MSAALNWSNKHLIGQTTKPPVQSLSMIYYTQFDQVSVLQQHLSSFIPKVKKNLETSLTCCLHLLPQLSRIAVPVDDILRLVCSGAPVHLLSGFRRSTRFCQAHLASASISVGHYTNEITPIKCDKGHYPLTVMMGNFKCNVWCPYIWTLLAMFSQMFEMFWMFENYAEATSQIVCPFTV